MAKFLETQAISSELLKIIKDAKEKIILVSPYLKVNPQIQERLKTKGKMGTLSEIVIIYGKRELEKSEIEWINEIQDLKVIEKSNLHAKCYLNEEKAIICSMNLYDYSMQNNIEMGFLITKKEDEEAYIELIEEINNIKINGIRKNFTSIKGIEAQIKMTSNTRNLDSTKEEVNTNSKSAEFTPDQKLKFRILKYWRNKKSKTERINEDEILTNSEITSLTTAENLDKNNIYQILSKKTVNKYGEEILTRLKYSSDFTIAKVINTWYQDNSNSYDRVRLKILKTGEEKWYDTISELPYKDKIVAVKINKTWFNEFFYLD